MKSRILTGIALSMVLFVSFASTARATDTPTEAEAKELATPMGTLGGAAMGAAGGSTAVGAAGAVGIGGAVSAGAAVGIVGGIGIEHATGAGSKAGDLLYENSNRKTAAEAVDKFDSARDSWNKGSYGDAAVDGAGGVGKMIEGFINW